MQNRKSTLVSMSIHWAAILQACFAAPDTGSDNSIPISIPTGVNFTWNNTISIILESMRVRGHSLTRDNTALVLLGVDTGLEMRLFPGKAEAEVSGTNQDIDATNEGFSIPSTVDTSQYFVSTLPQYVKLLGTPYKDSDGLISDDYIPDMIPVAVPGNGTITTGPISLTTAANVDEMDPNAIDISTMSIAPMSLCPNWQQNVLITQFGIGVIFSTCIVGSGVLPARDVTRCVLQVMEYVGSAGGYGGESWSTNCAVALNDATQAMNNWSESVKRDCAADLANCDAMKAVSADFSTVAGFDLIEPKLAPFCSDLPSPTVFSSLILTCVGTAVIGSDMRNCVKFVLSKLGYTDIDDNCVDSWQYITSMVSRNDGESGECKLDVTSDACKSKIESSLKNFKTWNSFDPSEGFYAMAIMGPGAPTADAKASARAALVGISTLTTMAILILF